MKKKNSSMTSFKAISSDTYRNLTYKHIMALKWFTENYPHVNYLLKLDDDVFVNIPAVHEHLLNNKQQTKYLLGRPMARTVSSTGKWKVIPEEFAGDQYPEYVGGPSIFYSNDFVIAVFNKMFKTLFLDWWCLCNWNSSDEIEYYNHTNTLFAINGWHLEKKYWTAPLQHYQNRYLSLVNIIALTMIWLNFEKSPNHIEKRIHTKFRRKKNPINYQ